MNQGKYLYLEEVMERLRIGYKTAWRRTRTGVLKSFKEGGRICVLETDFEEYLQRRMRETMIR